jgi:hypothetical protein
LPPTNWWKTIATPFGSTTQENDGWEDLDGEIEFFFGIEELLTGQCRKSFWEHERLDWDQHVPKLLHEDHFHIRFHMPLEDFEALVELLRNEIAPNFFNPTEDVRN